MNSTINCSHHVIHQIARPYSPQRGKFVFLPTSLYFPHSQLLATIFLLSVFMSLMVFFSFFRLHIQLIPCSIYLFCLISLSILPLRSIHVVVNSSISFSWLKNVPLCIYSTSSLSVHPATNTDMFFPYLGYCE